VALRDLAGDAIHTELIADQSLFRYRPAATAEAFARGEPLVYDLAELTARCGAGFRRELPGKVAARRLAELLVEGAAAPAASAA
jgi:hypothetical protein